MPKPLVRIAPLKLRPASKPPTKEVVPQAPTELPPEDVEVTVSPSPENGKLDRALKRMSQIEATPFIKESIEEALRGALKSIATREDQIVAQIAKKVQDQIAVHLDYVEAQTFYRVLEFFKSSPLMDLKKVTRAELGDSAHSVFCALLRQGWRYMGDHFDSATQERYTLLCRPQQGVTNRDQWLAAYKAFNNAQAAKGTSSYSPLPPAKAPVGAKKGIAVKLSKPKS